MEVVLFYRLGLIVAVLVSLTLPAEPVRVRQPQGVSRGFLTVRTDAGKAIGYGEVIQTVRGSVLTTRLTYHFNDGSLDDETTTFTQRRVFHVLTDHHIQRGPFFKEAIDISVNTATGLVVSHTEKKEGDEKNHDNHKDIPPDLANGIVGTILDTVALRNQKLELPYLAASGKGRMVKLVVTPAGQGSFHMVGVPHKANIYRVHIDVGGIAGAVAPIIGKQPEDQFIWILPGVVPTIVRQVGQLYVGGPILSMEQAGASFTPIHSGGAK